MMCQIMAHRTNICAYLKSNFLAVRLLKYNFFLDFSVCDWIIQFSPFDKNGLYSYLSILRNMDQLHNMYSCDISRQNFDRFY